MADAFGSLRSWATFAGCVLVVAVLYWAQAVLVPVSLAILLTFVLTPPVIWLQRRIGRTPAVLLVVTLVFSALGLSAWGIARQMGSLSSDLITYRTNIREESATFAARAAAGRSSAFSPRSSRSSKTWGSDRAQRDVVAAGGRVERPDPPASAGSARSSRRLSTAGFVIVLVLFMLLEREDLRNRLIGLIGHGHLAVTTKAFDEAGSRVSRQLLLQTLVNAIYGAISAVGLWLFGVPYPLFWGAARRGAAFHSVRGPLTASVGPFLISLAALPGWTRPLEVAGFYVLLELFTNLVLETVCMPAPPAFRRWRCSSPWRSGPGCGGRSAC